MALYVPPRGVGRTTCARASACRFRSLLYTMSMALLKLAQHGQETCVEPSQIGIAQHRIEMLRIGDFRIHQIAPMRPPPFCSMQSRAAKRKCSRMECVCTAMHDHRWLAARNCRCGAPIVDAAGHARGVGVRSGEQVAQAARAIGVVVGNA